MEGDTGLGDWARQEADKAMAAAQDAGVEGLDGFDTSEMSTDDLLNLRLALDRQIRAAGHNPPS